MSQRGKGVEGLRPAYSTFQYITHEEYIALVVQALTDITNDILGGWD